MRTYSEPDEPLITNAEQRQIDAALRSLESVRRKVAAKEEFKDRRVTWYLDGSQSLCLMIEPPNFPEPWPEHIGYSSVFKASSGGDW